MLTSEVSIQPVRVNSAYLDGGASVYSIRLLPADARSLGLREGQVLNATVAARPEGNMLLLGGNAKKNILLPRNSGLEGGVRLSVTISATGGAVLTMLPRLEKKISSDTKVDRIHSLLGRAAGVGKDWLRTLTGVAQDGSFSRQPSVSMGAPLVGLNPQGQIAQIGRDLYLTMLQSGLFHEYHAKGSEGVQANVKELILKLLRVQQMGQGDRLLLTAALDDIESNQLEALGASLNRGVSLNWPVPLINDWPVSIHIEADESGPDSEASGSDEDEREWRVDLKFRVDETSNLDARIRLRGEGIGLHLWCPSLSLYQEAMSHRNWLKEVAESVGLQISELHIFPSEKVSPQRSAATDSYTGINTEQLGISIDI